MCKSSSLSRCLMMPFGVSHRCFTIIMQRMCCQRSTLHVGNSCYIPAVMGRPKDASGCHCVLSLCHLMYHHLPKYPTMAFEKIPKIQIPSTANTTYQFYPATALCTWRIQNHQTTFHRGCSFTHSASDHPSTPFPVVPTGRFWGPLASFVHSIHGGARGEELLHDGGVAVVSRPVQRCRTSGAEGLGDVNGWLHPVALHRPPPLQWKKLQSVE